LRGLECTQDPFANIGLGRLQGRDEIGQKLRRVVVLLIQRQLGGWSLALGQPSAHQRSFPKAGRR
jgi:hypothetical protein